MSRVFARRYELLDPIAEGGMGSVWLVRDQEDGGVKVAKFLRHSDAGSLLRFMREQSTRIHHPHVVTPISWAGEDDTVLFTMPLVRGGSVATLVGDWGPLPECWVVAVLEQTLSALEAVHAAQIVHRDVKPANLLLEPTGTGRPHVRLTDFGIAVPVDQPRLTSTSTSLGTPGYMPPEQDAGGDPDPRQDLYAVAMVGLEMLLGHRPPFRGDEIPATPLGRLLTRAGDPELDRRPPSATAMLAELRAAVPPTVAWDPGEVEVLDHFPELARSTPTVVRGARLGPPPTAPPPTAPPATTRPAPPYAVIALALVGVLLLALSVALVVAG